MKSLIAKVNHFLLFWILLVVVLIYGKPILIPIAFAGVLAMLMVPLIDFLDRKGWKRVFSTILVIVILLAFIFMIMMVLVGQVASLKNELPRIEQRANELINYLHDYVQTTFNYSVESQKEYLKSQVKTMGESSATYFTTLLTGVTGVIVQIIITLVVTFLLLFDKEKYRAFFFQILKMEDKGEKHEVLNRITKVSQQYLLGRIISMSILFVLYYIALVAIGVENALLLAGAAAIVNIIPYVGPILAAVFPVIMALVTFDSFEPAIWVIITFSVIQGIDNYFVTPFFMGGEVKLSALATILIIICGGFVWGIPGMILFVPLLSMVKIVFDHVDSLKPYGTLIGNPDKETPSKRFHNWLRGKRR
ncbi:AI-2E family transporter [Albibacterium profundi]|uniref:AI-2E family transporter n=1 Tax=Albibacterium profundi TaxID=3134906 RepID=A0ABV5CFE6_9SPHI